MGGLVFGLIALVLSFFSGTTAANIISLILGILGIILAANAQKSNPSGVAVAGLVLSIIAVVIGGIAFFSCTLCKLCAGAAVGSLL